MPTQLNVKDFGATGTGTLDDSPAIQRAIDAAESAPDRADVAFPPGNYRCLTKITLNLSRGGRSPGLFDGMRGIDTECRDQRRNQPDET